MIVDLEARRSAAANGAAGDRQAVVFSGGGATGAYEVGVVKALLAGESPATARRPFVPAICAGTSVGSFNAAYLVSRLDQRGPLAADDLEALWLERLSGLGRGSLNNGFYRFRLDPISYFNPFYYFPNPLRPLEDAAADSFSLFFDGLERMIHLVRDREPELRQRLAELLSFASFVSLVPFDRTIRDAIDLAAVRRSRTQLRIPATNWNTGMLTVFKNDEMTDRIGPLAIRASSAIPGIFPAVYVGAEPHVDGGVLMNTPLRLVTRNADVLHVVYLDPDVSRIPDSALESTLSATYRAQVIAWAKVVDDDIEDARAVNHVLALKRRIDRGEEVGRIEPDQAAAGLGPLFRRVEERRPPYRLLTIHRYHPRDDLTGGPLGLLRLERGHVRALVERGFADAAEHDCAASGCVLPEPETATAR